MWGEERRNRGTTAITSRILQTSSLLSLAYSCTNVFGIISRIIMYKWQKRNVLGRLPSNWEHPRFKSHLLKNLNFEMSNDWRNTRNNLKMKESRWESTISFKKALSNYLFVTLESISHTSHKRKVLWTGSCCGPTITWSRAQPGPTVAFLSCVLSVWTGAWVIQSDSEMQNLTLQNGTFDTLLRSTALTCLDSVAGQDTEALPATNSQKL